MKYHLAIDIGASSGRHIIGYVENGEIQLKEVYRFDNTQIISNGHECWDIQALARHVIAGLKAAGDQGYVPETVGIDTWGVDFVLVDANGLPVGDAVAYRDKRTDGMPEYVESIIPFEDLYARTGIQKAFFNTIYQLAALKKESPEQLEKAERLLFIPDYLNFVLTGKQANEYTDATTSSLVNARTKTWDKEIIAKLGLPEKIFHPLTMPGTELGGFTSAVKDVVGYDAKVILPACHDTGSAYLAVPARDDNAVYLSSGTWSIIGVENTEAITNKASLSANFSNEGGAWYRFRFLKNIMGLWMIQSIRRELNGVKYVEGKSGEAAAEALKQLSDYEAGRKYSFADLEMAARGVDEATAVINVNEHCFLNPESMIAEVIAAAEKEGKAPKTIGELIRCVYGSLAENYAEEVRNLQEINGKTYTSLNIVGGGSQDRYLNALTAEATGLEVFAGPTEGTAIGNLIVQMITSGEFTDLNEARKAIRK
jgi:rhamnulokinase